MEGTPAYVLTHTQLEQLMLDTARRAAELTVDKLRAELTQDPSLKQLYDLRGYILDRSTIKNPRARWASSHLIRRIETNSKDQPKSVAWFMKFQKETGLKDCPSRKSPTHGRSREWTFEDIANAWEGYYAFM